MRSNFTLPVLAAAFLTITGPPAYAAPSSLLGQGAASSTADYTKIIQPGTKYVNVASGKTVRFESGDRNFTWNFNGARNVSSFPLNDVAPQGMFDHPVQVYVTQRAGESGG